MDQPASPRRPSFFRRRYLIDRRFQLSIVFYFLGMFLFSIGLLFIGLRRTLVMMDEQAIQLDPKHTAMLKMLQNERQVFLTEYFVLYAVAIIVATVVGGVLVSHRVAGPMYRLRRILEDLAEGKDVNQIEFRKQDFLQELLPSLRKVAKRISGDRT